MPVASPQSQVSSLEFRDPEMLAAAIRNANLEACQLSDRPLPSRIARVRCPRICLDLVAAGPAMLYTGAMPGDCYTLSYVVACPGQGRSFNFDTEFSAGYMGFFPPGGVLDATSREGSVDAILTVPVVEFHAALATLFPEIPERVLARGAGLRVEPAAQVRLVSLLSGIEETIRHGRDHLAFDRVCCELEHSLLPAFIAALRSGCRAIVPEPTRRIAGRYRRLRQARDFIAAHMNDPVQVEDLCSELGLSERGIENLFQDLVGLAPTAFLRHQRLHRSRRALLAAESRPGAVKQAAIEAGFWHLGRFASSYQMLFGELPSETLAGRSGDP